MAWASTGHVDTTTPGKNSAQSEKIRVKIQILSQPWGFLT